MEDLAIRKDFTVHDNIFVNATCELLGGSPSPGSVMGGDGWCRGGAGSWEGQVWEEDGDMLPPLQPCSGGVNGRRTCP